MLCACGFKYTPLWIQGLKRLVLWIQILTLLEDQGLWIQALVLLCSCAKAASKRERERERERETFELRRDVFGSLVVSGAAWQGIHVHCGGVNKPYE